MEVDMRALVIYESMYGNTHTVAEHVATGLGSLGEARMVPVQDATDELVQWADVVVVGGPTHVHGMVSATSRKAAFEAAAKPGSELLMDPDAEGTGLREWFETLRKVSGKSAVAFDTRVDMAPVLTGRASRGITRQLRTHGFTLVAHPESFLVDKQNRLVAGEADRATTWATRVAGVFATVG